MPINLLTYTIIAVAAHYFASLVQIVGHRIFGHKPTIAKLYRVHANGHHAKYPPARLRSRVWIPNEEHITWYYALAFAPFVLVVYSLAPADVFGAFVLSLLASVGIHVYLHRHYHLQVTWLARFQWFRRKQRLHFIHHRYVHKNYAIVEFFWDKLMKTYCDEI